ncbi:MAG: leucine-rich repeat domain-containing protein, partial [Wujia sp.]
MRRTKRFASFALAACMGVSLLVNVPAGTVSAAEPDEVVSAEATETDAEALDEMQEAVYDESEADADGFKWNGTAIVGYVGKGGDVKIPKKCTSIGSSAFKGCDNLTSIVIPKGVTSIGSFAFMDCTGMASVEMPEGVTSIGHHAFWGCYKLKNIEIPV